MREISRLEILAIKTLTYECSETNKSCQNKLFSYSDFFKHIEDHKNGDIAEDCPYGCGKQVLPKGLNDHVVTLKANVNVSSMIDN